MGALVIAALLVGCGADAGGDAPCAEPAAVDGLRLNELQVIGSHNSYRRRMYAPLFAFVQGLSGLQPELSPSTLDYDHVPLVEQLETYGVRALELDLYNDPEGGRFYERKGLAFIEEPTASNLPELRQPGLKVLHIPDFDYETHHLTFRAALAEIRSWSDAHPEHLPLFIQLETKEMTVADALMGQLQVDLTTSVPFDAASAAAIDAEIREVFTDPARLITPDDVRGGHATLEAAVLAGGWPLVTAARGRVVFFMEGAAVDDYLAAAPGLEGRVVFPLGDPGQPHAGFVLRNDSTAADDIAGLVKRGYIVRAQADSGTAEARSGDTTRLRRALGSGAQIVSTDYYRPDPRGAQAGSGWTSYRAALPGGGPARANPVNGGAPRRLCQ
jgi:hypothetical protein